MAGCPPASGIDFFALLLSHRCSSGPIYQFYSLFSAVQEEPICAVSVAIFDQLLN
jgi:hypothetical protein